MAIFTVIQNATGEQSLGNLAEAIAEKYPTAHLALDRGIWLVSDSGTAVDVSNKIGITPGIAAGSAVVFEMASYYGRTNPAVWSWIKSNWEGPPIG